MKGQLPVSGQTKSLKRFTDLVVQLERERKSHIFSIIHAAPGAHLCSGKFPEFVKRRKQFDGYDNLEVILHSPGGDADVAFRLAKFFRRRFSKFSVIVPLMAQSAATVLCLAADNIFMGEFAELGPIDVQIHDPVERGAEPLSPLDEFKSMEFLRDYALEVFDFFTLMIIQRSGMSVKEAIHESAPYVTAMVRPLFEKIDPLEVGGHRRALSVGEEYAKRLLTLAGNPVVDSIVQRLIWKYPSHDFGIDCEEALDLKLPIEALDRSQDERLTGAIMELIQDGISFHGFVSTQASASASATLPKTKRRRSHAVPNSSNGVVAAGRRAVS